MIQKGVNIVKELDTALVDLRKTTTMSSTDLKDFYSDANEAAKEYGVTTKDLDAVVASIRNVDGLLIKQVHGVD